MEQLVSGPGASREDAGPGGERRAGGEAQVTALEQDLGAQTPEKVIHEDGAAQE